MFRLWCKANGTRWSVELDSSQKTYTIGRDSKSQVFVPDDMVSEHHCRLFMGSDDLVIEDMTSGGGVFVNGQKVQRSVIQIGDLIRIGKTHLTLARATQSSPPALFTDSSMAARAESEPHVASLTPRVPAIKAQPVFSTFTTASALAGVANVEQLQQILVFCQRIVGELELPKLLSLTLECLLTFTGANRGLILLQENSSGELTIESSHQIRQEALCASQWLALREMTMRVLTSGEQVLQNASQPSSRIAESSFVCLPIRIPVFTESSGFRRNKSFQDSVLGFIYLDKPIGQFAASRVDPSLLSIFGTQAGVALRNARNYQRATRDPLTGLLNRDSFCRLFQSQLERAERNHQSLALVILDLDHFKSINDRYGHPFGDAVLTEFVEFFRSRLRDTDLFGRYGGEEFLICMNESTEFDAYCRIGLLLKELSLTPLTNEGLTVTASAGLVTNSSSAETLSDLIEAADRALYQAKFEGRNRIVAWHPEIAQGAPTGNSMKGLLHGDVLEDQRFIKSVLSVESYLFQHECFQWENFLHALKTVYDHLQAKHLRLFLGSEIDSAGIVDIGRNGARGGTSGCLISKSVYEHREQIVIAVDGQTLSRPLVIYQPLTVGLRIYGVLRLEFEEEGGQLAKHDYNFLEKTARKISFFLRVFGDEIFADWLSPSQSHGASKRATFLLEDLPKLFAQTVRVSGPNQQNAA